MKQCYHTALKVFACFLVILSGFTAVLSGGALYYSFYDSGSTYAESQACRVITSDYVYQIQHLAYDSVSTYAESQASEVDAPDYNVVYDAEADGLSNAEFDRVLERYFSPKETNFRYVIKDANTGRTLRSSLVDTEAVTYVSTWELTDDGSVLLDGYILQQPNVADAYSFTYHLHEGIAKVENALLPVLIISLLAAAISLIYLLCAAGHRVDAAGITPNLQDKVPLDLYLAIVLGIAIVCCIAVVPLFRWEWDGFVFVSAVGLLLTLKILSLATLLTCVTRLKLGRYFYQNTICYRVLRFFWRLCKRFFAFCDRALRALPIVWKVAVIGLFLLPGYVMGHGFAFILHCVVVGLLCYIALQMDTLRKAGEQLAAGNADYRVDTSRMLPVFRVHGENLNSLSEGLAIAVEEQMKSERMKTDLITNVSHDIKTPLTSIINYVDLLKKEQLEGQAAEYVAVLERQSARLKKLTEDLVEASKASAGSLNVSLKAADVGELVSQAVAEYTEKLSAAKLDLIISGDEEPIYAEMDGSLTWRILSNLLSNVCKYSQAGTRVYLDIERAAGTVQLSIKNISKEPLNIPADELMERFVRGDSSRHTEGSGLGLNIAQSLAALQKGSLQTEIDGDLFKVTLSLPAAAAPRRRKSRKRMRRERPPKGKNNKIAP